MVFDLNLAVALFLTLILSQLAAFPWPAFLTDILHNFVAHVASFQFSGFI